MKSDAKRLNRLARAQRALAGVAAADRALAQRAYEDSAAQADLIVSALNGDHPLHGLAVSSMADALRRNGRATERLRRRADAAALDHTVKDRTAEALETRAADETKIERAAAERRRIEELTSAPARRR